MIEIKIPSIGESINEATIAQWLKKDGDYVKQDEVICELESEKASFELNAEQAGTLHILVAEGADVKIGQTIGQIDETASAPVDAQATEPDTPPAEGKPTAEDQQTAENKQTAEDQQAPSATREQTPQATGKGVVEIKIPAVGESINEVTLLNWTKEEGEYVKRDEVICELESEKASFEVNAEEAGRLHQLAAPDDTLEIGQVVATIDTDVAPPADAGSQTADAQETPDKKETTQQQQVQHSARTAPHVEKPAKATPVASAMMAERHLKTGEVKGTGPSGKIIKQDVLAALEHPGTAAGQSLFSREVRREKMSNLRKTISRRLVEAKNNTAMLTTFNEVDLTEVKAIRKQYKEAFKEKHGVSLGFMSFFTKACCFALQEWPAVNAYLDGTELIYHEYCDISIAVSTPKGLVVPVIRNAESLSMAGIEKEVIAVAKKARDGKLSLEEMTGGTFTITNGGVFGSLMSTPIINPPQSAILGMHKIEDRPVAINGQVVVRPMMYIALSYDHRVIDGKESVSFLVRVKELLEDPGQLLFGKDPVKTLLEV